MNLYHRLVRIFVRSIGVLWILCSVYGFVAAIRIPENRLLHAALAVAFGIDGVWLVRPQTPFGKVQDP